MSYRIANFMAILMTVSLYAQEYKKTVQSFYVDEDTEILFNASFIEIEIEEWNKNKVEITPVMYAEGLSKQEAQEILDEWDIDIDREHKKVVINSNTDLMSSEYFFMGSDKIIANFEMPEIQIPNINMDSIVMVMPRFEDFNDIEINIESDSLHFDFERFKNDKNYMKEWQKKMQENMKVMNETLKKQMEVLNTKEVQREMKRAQQLAKIHSKQAEKHQELMSKHLAKREKEIQKILEERDMKKNKKLVKLKVPKSSLLRLNVDYCKVTTKS